MPRGLMAEINVCKIRQKIHVSYLRNEMFKVKWRVSLDEYHHVSQFNLASANSNSADNFHVPCILLFTVYFHVPCNAHFTVYFHSVISMFLFLCYWLQLKWNAVNQTIQLCFYQRFTIGQSIKRTSCNRWKWITTQYTVIFKIVSFFPWGLFWRRCS